MDHLRKAEQLLADAESILYRTAPNPLKGRAYIAYQRMQAARAEAHVSLAMGHLDLLSAKPTILGPTPTMVNFDENAAWQDPKGATRISDRLYIQAGGMIVWECPFPSCKTPLYSHSWSVMIVQITEHLQARHMGVST